MERPKYWKHDERLFPVSELSLLSKWLQMFYDCPWYIDILSFFLFLKVTKKKGRPITRPYESILIILYAYVNPYFAKFFTWDIVFLGIYVWKLRGREETFRQRYEWVLRNVQSLELGELTQFLWQTRNSIPGQIQVWERKDGSTFQTLP